MAQESSDLLTVAEAAKKLKCSRVKIYQLHKAGLIEMVKLDGRSTRVTQRSLDRLPDKLKQREENDMPPNAA